MSGTSYGTINDANKSAVASFLGGGVSPYTPPPVASGWTAVNSATLYDVSTDKGDGVAVVGAASGSTSNANIQGGKVAISGATKTVIAGIAMRSKFVNYSMAGLFFTDGTKFVTFEGQCFGAGAQPNIAVSHNANATTGGSDDAQQSTFLPQIFFMKMQDDGTNLTFWWSPVKLPASSPLWFQVYQELRGANLTVGPTDWGFYANAQTTADTVDCVLFDWEVS